MFGELQSALGAQILVDGCEYINFGGSSYLGLSSQPDIVAAGIAALRTYGAGMPPYPGQGLANSPQSAAEAAAIRLFHCEAAVPLSSGYHFGFAAADAVNSGVKAIFVDERAHASLHQAATASGLPSRPYRHHDLNHLEGLIRQRCSSGRPLVMTDGVTSTNGSIAPVEQLLALVDRYGGKLIVDESHSFGVLGISGRGITENLGLGRSNILAGGSLAKAFGVCGGIIPTTVECALALRSSKVVRGASPGMAATAAMCAAAMDHYVANPHILTRLRKNTARAKAGARELGLDIAEGAFPVIAFSLCSEARMTAVRDALRDRGINVYLSGYGAPHLPSMIRCAIFSDHSNEHIDHLISQLRELL